MNDMGRSWLIFGGVLSFGAALLHLAAIAGGPSWYRALGAGERMVRMAQAGWATPAWVTVGIAAVLSGFGAYALSGAGVLPRLPWLRAALVAIAGVYLARGLLVFVPDRMWRPDLSSAFKFWSSAIVLGYGLIHLVGVWRGWTHLKGVS